MLARLRAALKGSVGTRLSYEDLAATLGASLTKPERWVGELRGVFEASWRGMHGTEDWVSFSEYWRRHHIFPALRAIADEPTWDLQRHRTMDQLFDEEEKLTTSAEVLKLPADQAAAFLLHYPDPTQAGLDIELKRNSVGLEMCFQILNKCALMEIVSKEFGEDSVDLGDSLNFYANAFEHLLRVQIATRNLHVIDGGYTPDDSRMLEAASAPYSARMRSGLNSIRLEISERRGDGRNREKLRQQCNEILRAKSDFFREVLGHELQIRYIEERDIA